MDHHLNEVLGSLSVGGAFLDDYPSRRAEYRPNGVCESVYSALILQSSYFSDMEAAYKVLKELVTADAVVLVQIPR